MELYQIIKKPVATEKSVNMETANKFMFVVHQKATKVDVLNAMNKIYGVKTDNVNMVNVRKKTRAISKSRDITRRAAERRAIVTLRKGEKLDLTKIKS